MQGLTGLLDFPLFIYKSQLQETKLKILTKN